ncbi:mechanosensitive ion channel [Coraliomargarita sp. SDUM461004]|uniref:Mechanosensitive ion channel n=1 Tax=Thalassobacterium sedimentorum TaxID=3041258 RepID=A0ABU1AED9_9BACT|nr:mechanosensitive ion channel domain-containing protein [Coraliomargarita sp. SDUM461004]MDQ8193080.1 mechanosensitive ion channel [Coraliomargarita sp. SDUM461004]
MPEDTSGIIAAQVAEPTVVEKIIDVLALYGMKVLAAVIIIVVGLWLAKAIKNCFVKTLQKREVDATLIGFFGSMIHGALVIFVVIAAVGKLGVQTTSFVAVIGAAGLAVGLALQGSLSNFASGVLLILFKPFKAGDFVKAGGEAGVIVEVGILTTEMKTPDNIQIIMPNSSIMGGSITNVSAHPTRRVDMTVGVGYGDDLNKAKQIMEDLLAADERVLKDPAVTIAVANLGDSSVDFIVRPWVKSGDYWAVKFDFTKAVKEKFDAEGISIPFPQRDVHVFQEQAS